MAVEARQVNHFPSNGGFVVPFRNSAAAPFGYGVVPMKAVDTAAVPSSLTYAVKSDSGLTYAAAVPFASRKRPRDDAVAVADPIPASSPPPPLAFNAQNHHHFTPFAFLGEDISVHLHQQQVDLDGFIAQQTEKARIEINDERRRQRYSSRRAIDESPLMKKFKAKEQELEKIGKINSLLEDRAKSLSLENQIWRELAQANEATANALRSNLEQVLAQQAQRDGRRLAGDAHSTCGSNSIGDDGVEISSGGSNSICRSCGGGESRVLLLPCRHLCLCATCGSRVHTCPVCRSAKTASLHVNLSS